MSDEVSCELVSSSSTISSIDSDVVHGIADALVDVFRNGGRLVIMGNGGSAADAQHLAGEFSGRYLFDRPPLDAIALSGVTPITAIGNDYSFDDVFSRQVRGMVRECDAVIGISTSGNSTNVVKAIEAANDIGATTIAFTGSGGVLKDKVDLPLVIPSTRTPRIQEGYLVAGHSICGLVERRMFGRPTVFIDRDDTIVRDVPYCDDPAKVVMFDGVPDAIRRLNDAGYLVIMVTNQSGIGRGYFTEATLSAIHERITDEVTAGGGRIDAIYHCPHHPDEHCGCRKPEPGMVLRAMEEWPIDPTSSFVIGDSERDMGLAERMRMRGLKVTDENGFVRSVDEILGS